MVLSRHELLSLCMFCPLPWLVTARQMSLLCWFHTHTVTALCPIGSGLQAQPGHEGHVVVYGPTKILGAVSSSPIYCWITIPDHPPCHHMF
jgi:hypothetical protein